MTNADGRPAPGTPDPDATEGDQERDPTGPDHITRADINEALDCLGAVADAADAITALAVSFAAQLANRSAPNGAHAPTKRRG